MYDAKSIKVLKGLEPVRKRPGMFIPDLECKGFHHLLWEVVSNSFDEHMEGFGNELIIRFSSNLDSVDVRDFGRGIPFGEHPEGGSAATLIMTRLHSGGKFEDDSYCSSGGTFGVGLGVVNALSEVLVLRIFDDRAKLMFEQSFSRGEPICEPRLVPTLSPSGTQIRFKPDSKIFGSNRFDLELIVDKLKCLACLNEMKIYVFVGKEKQAVLEPGTIEDLFSHVTSEKNGVPIKNFSVSAEGIDVDFIFGFFDGDFGGRHFVNNVEVFGGTILDAFVFEFSRHLRHTYGLRASTQEILKGVCICSSSRVRSSLVQFKGQVKSQFTNNKVGAIVKAELSKRLPDVFCSPDVKSFLDVHASAIAEAVKAKERVQNLRKKLRGSFSVSSGALLPGKLFDCSSRKVEERELFLCEGQSAGGILKLARDSRFQAVLPLRGKVLNVFKSTPTKIAANKELMDIFVALGGEKKRGTRIVIPRLRYSKVILAHDADVDGLHIKVLLIGFFYRFLKPLLVNGNVYSVECPLFSVRNSKEKKFFFSKKELDVFLSNTKKKWIVTRFKGLGEMNVDQMEVIVHPSVRRLRQLKISNDDGLERCLFTLLGGSVSERLGFLRSNNIQLERLDI